MPRIYTVIPAASSQRRFQSIAMRATYRRCKCIQTYTVIASICDQSQTLNQRTFTLEHQRLVLTTRAPHHTIAIDTWLETSVYKALREGAEVTCWGKSLNCSRYYDSHKNLVNKKTMNSPINTIFIYVAAKATYSRLLHGKIGFLGFFRP